MFIVLIGLLLVCWSWHAGYMYCMVVSVSVYTCIGLQATTDSIDNPHPASLD